MRAPRTSLGVLALCLLLGAGHTQASEIADAARAGDMDRLEQLIRQKVDVNATEADGSTALHWAVYRDDEDAVKRLIKAGADVRLRTPENVTPLALAAINGNERIINLLLKAGADVNGTLSNGETPLMLAARTGRPAAIETLIRHGADIEARETLRGTTALMWAAANSRPEAVTLLIKKGADVSARSANSALGRKPYLSPTAKSRIDQVKAGIDVSGTSTELRKKPPKAGAADTDEAAAQEAEFAGLDRDHGEEKKGGGLTALVFAAREGDMASAKALIEGGADVNQTTHYGWSPLLTAVQNRYYKLASYFLEQGADPNIANEGGWTPLYIATDNRNIEGGDYPTRKPDMDHLELIKRLLAKGADPNLRMKSSTETRTIFTNQWLHEEGATPFLRAAQSGDVVLMKLLLEHGADPHIATEQGVTPLMVASGIGWVEGVTYEWSPEETMEAVKLIISLGADVNAQDHVDKRTALMGAAHKGRNDVVQYLVDHGADMSLHDIGSRDSIHKLAGVTWQAIDYADGLVRVGVQSSISHPETAALLRKLMQDKGLKVPPEGRTLDSICITDICKPETASLE